MDKDKLLARRSEASHGMPEGEVEVEGFGVVRVRGLSRYEVGLAQKVDEWMARERKLLAIGLVDPQLSESEAAQWQKVSVAGEIEPVSTRIAELSGMVDGAPKSGVPADGDEPGA